MFDEPMIQYLHSGCAVLVGTVGDGGEPHASRGWGLTVLDADAGRVRLLVDAADATTLANLRNNKPVAITTASVSTLRSLQLKGRVVQVEAATDLDEAKRAKYTTEFLADIHQTDGDPIEPLRLWADRQVVACVVDVDASFDQTPGPSAGLPMGRSDG